MRQTLASPNKRVEFCNRTPWWKLKKKNSLWTTPLPWWRLCTTVSRFLLSDYAVWWKASWLHPFSSSPISESDRDICKWLRKNSPDRMSCPCRPEILSPAQHSWSIYPCRDMDLLWTNEEKINVRNQSIDWLIVLKKRIKTVAFS